MTRLALAAAAACLLLTGCAAEATVTEPTEPVETAAPAVTADEACSICYDETAAIYGALSSDFDDRFESFEGQTPTVARDGDMWHVKIRSKYSEPLTTHCLVRDDGAVSVLGPDPIGPTPTWVERDEWLANAP